MNLKRNFLQSKDDVGMILKEMTDMWQLVYDGYAMFSINLVYIQQRKWLDNDENADLKSFIPKERRYLSHTGLERHWVSCVNLSITI